ncbi:translational GTPase TypA [Salinivirga cyanobacteriivorans]|uniref:Large ribosomal subunit assembly factor BipA n=1 Tax=Salinivirga cyanobacteriivorans TaxID=1307839 RepID=A0A0S2HZU5_9BACT|nr:translational GTPase TypA [Salinivirga cyanobacteriivorans]ALO15673.1 Tyrosine phosphorylated protein A [Salinivirga cyanobacteriivorans]
MNKKIRNVAIIAHVDHGKTTLVDKILHQCKLFGEHEKPGELIMDSNDLERERGITILSKNVSVSYNDIKINIIDTPGHSDFGGEVERVLNMADGVLLLVDAFEGTMPQTRFVLQKALEIGLKPVVVINKVDKPNCRPLEVQEEVFELMFNLDGSDEQLDFPTFYGSAKEGWMSDDVTKRTNDITSLLDGIIKYIPEPKVEEGPTQMRITSLDYSSYVGRIAIGKVFRGTLKANQQVAVIRKDKSVVKQVIKELFVYDGFQRKNVDEAESGELVAIVGLENFEIGETIAHIDHPDQLDPIAVDEPTMSMLFTINNSPFYGKEGKYVTSRHIKERLEKELEKNLALQVHDTDSADKFNVYGRGILHLSVLIENMRREGYELQVGQPQVLYKMIGAQKSEPFEELTIDVPDEYSGTVIEMVSQRKGEMKNMIRKGDRINVEFEVPSRGLIGLNNQVLTATAGEAIMNHRFIEYRPTVGPIKERQNGSLIAMESGTAIAYALHKLQDRGKFFVAPGENVYAGQVIGQNTREGDLVLNVTKTKKLTNMRASGSDDKVLLAPPIEFSLEDALEYIEKDEYVEITPKRIRLRKILLDENDRKRAKMKS